MYQIDLKDICYIKGIGPKLAELFHKIGIYSNVDLIRYYPRAYEDWSKPVPIADANETCVIKATVDIKHHNEYTKTGKLMNKFIISDESGSLVLVYFNNKFISKTLQEGQCYFFRGKISYDNHSNKTMLSPEHFTLNKAYNVLPIYGQTMGLNSKQISSKILKYLNEFPFEFDDILSDEIREKYDLCKINYAIRNIHLPISAESVDIAKKRLIFDEMLILQLGMKTYKDQSKKETSHVLKKTYYKEFISLLPFELTNAQINAIVTCLKNMKEPVPMNRLLQGDVGSGKTAVAAALCFNAAKNSIQSAMMAPTEILAVQHYNSLKELLKNTEIKLALLVGSMTPKQKAEVYENLKNGSVDIAIGTHALISQGVEFKNLGLVITDEQHRFGVKQRNALSDKAKSPHSLVMSATPIPRTLAMFIYGDLDVSVLDEIPKGRQKIDTYCVKSELRPRVYKFIQKHLDEGRQAYIICPLIEEAESDLLSIEAYYESLSAFFPKDIIAILHGKMKSKEKAEIMEKFSKNETKILLSTTVVEVGVDVPNAVIMVIENAERYGLSQLHQLRGRVGRGKHKSTCILISDSENEPTKERLDLLCKNSDGFMIAQADLTARGPGDFFGKRQHGLPTLKIANMVADMEVLQMAQECSRDILEKDPELKNNELLKKEIANLFREY